MDEFTYKNSDLQTLFNRASETIRGWSKEFEQYLSPTARPESGRHRVFSLDDLKVFALVAEMKDTGRTYEDIHASLQSGQRGELPAGMEHLERSLIPLQTLLELDTAREQILVLREQVKTAQEKEEAGRNQLVRSEAVSEYKDAELERLRKQLAEQQTRIEELTRELGRLEGRAGKPD